MQQWVKKMTDSKRSESKLTRAVRLKQHDEHALEFIKFLACNMPNFRTKFQLGQAERNLVRRERRVEDVKTEQNSSNK